MKRLHLDSRLSEIPGALQWLSGALQDDAMPAGLRGALAVVLEELLTNIVRHGYADDPGPIEVRLEEISCGVVLEVRDRAHAFDPTSLRSPDLDGGAEDRPVGGLGVHLVRKIMDRVQYRRDGEENVLRAEKRWATAPRCTV